MSESVNSLAYLNSTHCYCYCASSVRYRNFIIVIIIFCHFLYLCSPGAVCESAPVPVLPDDGSAEGGRGGSGGGYNVNVGWGDGLVGMPSTPRPSDE